MLPKFEPRVPRVRWAVTVLAAVLLVTGCSSQRAPVRPIDVAQEKLTALIDDGTMISGFTIGAATASVELGAPPRVHYLYPESFAERPSVKAAGGPPWIRGRDFPLAESLDRARDLLEPCESWGSVRVNALSDSAVVTGAVCEKGGEVQNTVLLNDQVLPSITAPIGAGSLTTVWSEIADAGLGERLVRVEIARGDDQASVFFSGPDRDLTYQWSRGLAQLDSLVMSHPNPVTDLLDPATVTAERVADAFVEAMESLDDPQLAERITVEPAPGGDGAHLVLTALDYTPIVTVDLA